MIAGRRWTHWRSLHVRHSWRRPEHTWWRHHAGWWSYAHHWTNHGVDLAVDVWLFAVQLAGSWLGSIVVCKVELSVVQVNAESFLKLILHLRLLLINFLCNTVFNNVNWDLVHTVNVDVYSISSCNGIGNFLDALSMHLIHVCLQRASCRELSRAELASKVSILLLLQQYVHILELFLAVIAEWFEDVDASLFPSHIIYYLFITKVNN